MTGTGLVAGPFGGPGARSAPGAAGPADVPTVLIVDDDARIRSVVSRALALEGIATHTAPSAEAALRSLSVTKYDLVLLDLLMPGRDGFAALDDIMSGWPAQAVLVLSCRSDAAAKIRSLDLGADDYLTKPFHIAELRARVRARLRGRQRSAGTTITHGRLMLDLVRHRADIGKGSVQLSEREFELLRELLDTPGRVVTKQHLLTRIWGYPPGESASASNVVDVCVRRLRARLGGGVIETVRGEGYRVA